MSKNVQRFKELPVSKGNTAVADVTEKPALTPSGTISTMSNSEVVPTSNSDSNLISNIAEDINLEARKTEEDYSVSEDIRLALQNAEIEDSFFDLRQRLYTKAVQQQTLLKLANIYRLEGTLPIDENWKMAVKCLAQDLDRVDEITKTPVLSPSQIREDLKKQINGENTKRMFTPSNPLHQRYLTNK